MAMQNFNSNPGKPLYLPKTTTININSVPEQAFKGQAYNLFNDLVKTPYEYLEEIGKKNSTAIGILMDELFWIYKLYNDYYIEKAQADHFIKIRKAIELPKNSSEFLANQPYSSIYKIIRFGSADTKLTMAILLGNSILYSQVLRDIGEKILTRLGIWGNILYYAALGGNVNIFESLVKLGARQDPEKILDYAIIGDNINMFKYIVKIYDIPSTTMMEIYNFANKEGRKNFASFIINELLT